MRHILLWFGLIALAAASCQPAAVEDAVATDTVQSDTVATTIAAMPMPDLEAIDLGEAVYAAHCASCHGANLEGEANWKIQNEDNSFRAPPHDASGHTWHHGDPTLLEAIRLGGRRLEELNIGGTSNMPTFAGVLTDEEVTAVLTYIKSTWPEATRILRTNR
ncbi:MAG TPA: cytochrome c [Chloroflexota bacterium]|nr:cytochrome c [Chloroflexota bacterium]HUM67446.1 cytochrome c [Chloroflexota bacterium]